MEEIKEQLTELRTSQTPLTANKVDHLMRFTGAAHHQGDPLPENVAGCVQTVQLYTRNVTYYRKP